MVAVADAGRSAAPRVGAVVVEDPVAAAAVAAMAAPAWRCMEWSGCSLTFGPPTTAKWRWSVAWRAASAAALMATPEQQEEAEEVARVARLAKADWESVEAAEREQERCGVPVGIVVRIGCGLSRASRPGARSLHADREGLAWRGNISTEDGRARENAEKAAHHA